MRRKNITNQIIRESITEAFIRLLSDYDFADVKITDIVLKAGVSRVSFYRNYKNKEDILTSAIHETVSDWWETQAKEHRSYTLPILKLCYQYRDFLCLLHRHQLIHLLYWTIYRLISSDNQSQSAYAPAILSGALYGLLLEWLRCGMVESPEEIYRRLADFNPVFL